MTGTDLFSVFRHTLVIVFGTYAVVKLFSVIWRWQLAMQHAARHELLFRRYVVVTLLRVRLRRFWSDVVQIAALAGLFFYLVWRQAG